MDPSVSHHRLEIAMQEYFDGTRTIVHEDGSTTYVHYEHEPHTEPLTMKQNLAIIGAGLALVAVPIGIAVIGEKWSNRIGERHAIRTRQRLNKEIYNSMKH